MNLNLFLKTHSPVAMIKVVAAEGSTPRNPGAFMLVSETGQFGSIGGGRLEFDAVQAARSRLAEDGFFESVVSLGPEIGQCCGGRVSLETTVSNSEAVKALISKESPPEVYIFGAGHVGAAIAAACAPLPLTVRLIDERDGYPGEIVIPPEYAVRNARAGSAFVIVTHDHASDFVIAEEALSRADAAYVGMIGSKTKRAVLERRLTKAGVSAKALVCPIGATGHGDKRPEVIAAFVAAELMSALRES